MKSRLLPILLALVAFLAPPTRAADAAKTTASAKSLRALLITGGCCHDYAFQAKTLTEGLKKFGDITWTIVNEGGNTTKGQIKLYDNPDWAKPYDVVVHNECFADTDDPAYVAKIVAAHRAGVPAVVIHCAMHTYRALKEDTWREFLGVTSRKHDHQSNYPVRPVLADHPALKNFPSPAWTTPMDELYVIEKLWPNAQALAVAKSEKDGNDYPCVWINSYHGTRVFGTTFGHSNATWSDPAFITLLAHGLHWAAGR
ncbi:MAG: ThuA domain-containing protein [Undibacterium sp.]|nr:ThuA domain-containing protein [Opitutaceae bacterium]